jgi:hypothetical protein
VTTLSATVVAEGSSDRVLIPFIRFLLDEHCPRPHRLQFAEGLPGGPLDHRLRQAAEWFPCEILFVHRDADRASVAERETEIERASHDLRSRTIRIIPVRMTESWLLLDETAIRRAAGNLSGTAPLGLPAPGRIEALPDPKDLLFRSLSTAKELGARRMRAFRPEAVRHRVAELMEDVSVLRRLPSFRHFEAQVIEHFSAPHHQSSRQRTRLR